MKSRTRKIALVALTVGLMTAGAYIRIPIGPVPVTLQTLFVLIGGAVLGPGLGATAMTAYILLGLMGLPVFSAGGGPQYVLSPTFGYLLSFPLASAAAGWIAGRSPSGSGLWRNVLALSVGTAIIYCVGVPYLALNLRRIQEKSVAFPAVLMMGMVPFLPGDLAKIVFGSLVIGPVRRSLDQIRTG
ncbi:MAG: biotin transporter BioY [bacterium]|nr:MAG: biotin transporter BioY [bacterium]